MDEPEVNQTFDALFLYDNFFTKEQRSVTAKLARHFEYICDSCVDKSNRKSFASKSTTMDLVQLVRSFAMKSYGVYPSRIETIYPYLWRDILVEQGRLKCKKVSGVNKYPLKKLLEQRMPKEFVYRKKSAFAPPTLKYLENPQVLKFFERVIIKEGKFVKNIVPNENLKKTFYLLSKNRCSQQMSNMIWSIMFTELWLKTNYDNIRDII